MMSLHPLAFSELLLLTIPTLTMQRSALRLARAQPARSMSANAKVFINKDTKVICQGLTGKQGTFHTQHSIVRGRGELACNTLSDVAASRARAHARPAARRPPPRPRPSCPP